MCEAALSAVRVERAGPPTYFVDPEGWGALLAGLTGTRSPGSVAAQVGRD